MPIVLLPLLRRFWLYLLIAGVCFFVGGYAGYRFEVGAVQVQKLALATQQKDDAAAIAAANAIAASELAQAEANANAAEARLASANAQAGVREATLTGQIDARAAQPGQDAPDSPVLAAALDDLAKANP
jgi:multidrug resistance efflux pump